LRPAGSKNQPGIDAGPMSQQSEEIIDNFVEQTPYQNIVLAFELIV